MAQNPGIIDLDNDLQAIPNHWVEDRRWPVTSDLHPGHTCSLASTTQISPSIFSSSLVSTVVFSSSLTMSENFQNPALLGTSNSRQLSVPVVSHAVSSLTGRGCDFYRISVPTASSTWLPPSGSGTSFQPLMGSVHLYQHSSTPMLSRVTSQSQISTSTSSYPCVFAWDTTGSTEMKSSSLGDFTVNVTNQNTAMSMSTLYAHTSGDNNMVPVYPSLSSRLVQRTTSQVLHQGHSLSLPYQEGSQVNYYNQRTLGPLISGERGPRVQSYGSVSNTGSRASATQQEIVMVVKEIQPTGTLPPVSASGMYYSASAQLITETRVQVMETSRGLQPPSQTYFLPQTSEFPKTRRGRNIQTLESNPPPEVGGISIASVQSSSNPLALPPAKKEEQTENNNLKDIKNKLSKPLDDSQIPVENQDDVLLPIQVPDIHQLLACIDPLNQEKQPGSGNTDLRKKSLSLEDQTTVGIGTELSGGFAIVAALVGDSHLPQLFSSLKDLDQSKGPEVIKTQDTRAIELSQMQERSPTKEGSSGQARKNKHKASEPLTGAPEAPEGLSGGNVSICNVADGDEAPANTTKRSRRRSPITASSRTRKTRSSEQAKTTRPRKRNSKKADEGEQSGNKVTGEEKRTIPRMKRKKNQPEFSEENFKKPQSRLGMHMLESVQVFHALGKKMDKKPGLSSSQDLGNSRNPSETQPRPAIKPWLNTIRKHKSPENTHVKTQKPEGSVEKECPSPSQDELPRPGKVKLVPLPFLIEEKSPVCRVPRRPWSLASHRPALASSTQPGSTNAAQPTAVDSSQQAPASLTDSACSSLGPVSTNST
ncbi:hypothetical protein MC885_000874 [Smutsia gigantea]|nr:hypothetical protein MC885_000874 [Smutsia gigantea]